MDFLSWWQTLPSKMDPVLISIGPLTIYWYSTMYLVAFGVVYILCSNKIKQNKFNKINWKLENEEWRGVMTKGGDKIESGKDNLLLASKLILSLIHI